MKYDLIIKNAKIINAESSFDGDIGVKDGRINALSQSLDINDAAKVIDAKGRFVIPGGIDVHVHLEIPFCGTISADDFVTGTRAAAAGGVTTIIDFATEDLKKGIIAGVEARRKIAEGRACVDFGFHGVLIGWNKEKAAEIPKAIDYGIPSYKMYMIYEKEGWNSDDKAIFQALEMSKDTGMLLAVHAESESVMNVLIERCLKDKKKLGAWGHVVSRPNFIEAEAAHRAIFWAQATGGRLYIVHVSTGETAQLIKEAKENGVFVQGETCPHYLLLDDEVFINKKTGHLYATCPQIKKKADQERLWRALTDGELKIVSTDTCTFNKKQKGMWGGDFTKIPYGLPGVETLIPAVYTFGVMKNRFAMNQLVSLVSANPAKLMGLYPKKGVIMPGADADIVILDTQKKRKINHAEMETNCDWSPYNGFVMCGFPDTTILRGKVIVEKGKFVGKEGDGQFVKRNPSGKL